MLTDIGTVSNVDSKGKIHPTKKIQIFVFKSFCGVSVGHLVVWVGKVDVVGRFTFFM